MADAHTDRTSCHWGIPKTAFGERNTCSNTAMGCIHTWCNWESDACGELGTDAFWGYHGPGILQR